MSSLQNFRDYRRQGGTFSAALCNSAQMLSRFFHSSPILVSPSDDVVVNKHIEQLPSVDTEALYDYFDSNVAMQLRCQGRKVLDNVYHFFDKDF
jgi:hypothetical protein